MNFDLHNSSSSITDQTTSQIDRSKDHTTANINREASTSLSMQPYQQFPFGNPPSEQYSFNQDQAVDPQLCMPPTHSMPTTYPPPTNFTSQSAFAPRQSQIYGEHFSVSDYGNNMIDPSNVAQFQPMPLNHVQNFPTSPAQQLAGYTRPHTPYFPLETASNTTGSPAQSSPWLSWAARDLTGTHQAGPCPFIESDSDDEEEPDNKDKPYSKLIWEALIQAPGYRLPLRDIYAWFRANTTKPQESGGSGWQNSIRHNLSMNQAFVNDKNDSIPGGNSKKANSIWMLTEEAVLKGAVESTTRFRKQGSKRYTPSRSPAIQRQRSGAMGGKAASRAARLRKNEEKRRAAKSVPTVMTIHTPPALSTSPLSSVPEQWSGQYYDPMTPLEDQLFAPTQHSLQVQQPTVYDYTNGPTSQPMCDINGVSGQSDLFMQPHYDPALSGSMFSDKPYYYQTI